MLVVTGRAATRELSKLTQLGASERSEDQNEKHKKTSLLHTQRVLNYPATVSAKITVLFYESKFMDSYFLPKCVAETYLSRAWYTFQEKKSRICNFAMKLFLY